MESRFKRIVLGLFLPLTLAFSAPSLEAAEDERSILDEVVSPDLKRREIEEDKIDSETIEIGIFGGVMSIEDFGSSSTYGIQLDLHITEDFFLEARGGLATLQPSSAEVLSEDITFFNDEDRDMTFYSLSVGYNLFPAQLFLGKTAYHSSFYLLAGAGNTEFGGNEYLTYHFGTGFKLFMSDWMALRVGMQNHIFTHDTFTYEKKIQNLEGIVGLTLFL